MNELLRVHTDGEMHRVGFDDGPKPLQLIHEVGEFLVFKIPGHSYWSGRGMQSYAETEFLLVRVRLSQPDARGWREGRVLEEIESVEPGFRWAICKKRLIAKANNLARGRG